MKSFSIAAVIVAAAFFSACASTNVAEPAANNSARNERKGSLDLKLLRLAERVPEFAGMHVDKSQNLVVSIAPSVRHLRIKRSELRRHINEVFRDHVGAYRFIIGNRKTNDPPRLLLRSARYRFVDLFGWKERLRHTLFSKEIYYLDINERGNRIEIGVGEALNVSEITELLRSLKIPRKAVVTKLSKPLVPQVSLIHKFRPIVGGTHVETPSEEVDLTCTLSFSANVGGQEGFVTASHCSSRYADIDQGTSYQPFVGYSGMRAGREALDPAPFEGGDCPTGYSCRYSDASFFRYKRDGFFGWVNDLFNPITGEPKIARPTVGVLLAQPHDRFEIAQVLPDVFQGSLVSKVGIATGKTDGEVGGTCVDILKDWYTRSYVLCQNLYEPAPNFNMISYFGDSGSPVFMVAGPNSVLLTGTHWGGTSDGSIGIFSPISGIRIDFGEQFMPTDCCPNIPWGPTW